MAGPLEPRGNVVLNQGGAHRQIRLHTPPPRPSLARDAELRAATPPEPPGIPAKPLEPLARPPRRPRQERTE